MAKARVRRRLRDPHRGRFVCRGGELPRAKGCHDEAKGRGNHGRGTSHRCGSGPVESEALPEIVSIRPASTVQARIYAPSAALWLKAGTSALGTFAARYVKTGPP